MNVQSQPSATPHASPGGKRKWLAPLSKLWSSTRARWILAVVGLAVVNGAVVLSVVAPAIRQRNKPVERPTLDAALAALDRHAYAEARRLAEQIDRTKLPTAEAGGPDYVLALVAAREAEDLWDQERKNYYLLAARYLEVARERKFERALTPEAQLLLGQSLFFAGRLIDSLPVLEEALEQVSEEQAGAIHLLLTEGYRGTAEPDLQRALEHNRAYLEAPDLAEADRAAAQLREAQLFWQLEDYKSCREALDLVPADAYLRPEVELLRGQLVMRSAQELKDKLVENSSEAERRAVKDRYEQAIKIYRRAQEDPLGDVSIRKAMYLTGICLMSMGDVRGALAQFERTRDLFRNTAEGIAAGLQEADLLRAAKRDDQALAAYRRTLAAMPESTEPFTNPWIAPAEFQSRVLAAYQSYVDQSQFEQAIGLTERLTPLFPPSQAVRLTAESYRTWARSLKNVADTAPEPKASETRKRSRSLYREAGRQFNRLAELEFTARNYPDDVWQCAESYLAGHDFSSAVTALDEYLKYELRRRRPLALVSMGEALLALGRLDEALVVLSECIEFHPNDAACFQARLWAARAHAEKGDFEAAAALLRENLGGELLTPESKEWRDSLFALGKLLASNQRYVEGIDRLEEAVARYPDSRQAIEARYLIAECCQQAAKIPQEKAAKDSIETARLAHLKEAEQFLEMAIRYYEQTIEVLNQRQEQTELSPLERTLLRNSYFSIGASLFELGRFEEAMRAYAAAANRSQHDPEVLEAFAQIAACCRRLNKPREARGAVQQALVVLDRIQSDTRFDEATIYSRREWKELLQWMSKL